MVFYPRFEYALAREIVGIMSQEQQIERYRIVRLASGCHSVHSLAHGETFHPVIGPVAEAEALYVRQLKLPERIAATTAREFVIWDVGLGAAANVVTVLRHVTDARTRLRILSFDHTLEPLQFALDHRTELGYLDNYEEALHALLRDHAVTFSNGQQQTDWSVEVADFPALVRGASATSWPKPDAILFDAYSPAKNPAMWTQPLFARIFELLDPARPCALPTYSRSTMLRVSLLLAGFFVGSGHATGEKEETTIAANSLDLLEEPLDRKWLQRARISSSAEPLWEPAYRQAPLSGETWLRLVEHSQFQMLQSLTGPSGNSRI